MANLNHTREFNGSSIDIDDDENINQLADMFSDLFVNNENITHNINEVRDENNNHNINEVRDDNIIHPHSHWIKKLILAALVIFVITMNVIHLLFTSSEENASNWIQSIAQILISNWEPGIMNHISSIMEHVSEIKYHISIIREHIPVILAHISGIWDHILGIWALI